VHVLLPGCVVAFLGARRAFGRSVGVAEPVSYAGWQMDGGCAREFHSSGGHFGGERLEKRNSAGSSSSEEIRRDVEECLLSSSSSLDVSRKSIRHLSEEIHQLPNIKLSKLLRVVLTPSAEVQHRAVKGEVLCQVSGKAIDSQL